MGTALKLPHPGIPMSSASKKFDLGKQGQDQSRILQFFNLMGSNVEKTAPARAEPDAQSIPVMRKSPEELRKSVSELLQRLDDEQKTQEKLAEESRRRF